MADNLESGTTEEPEGFEDTTNERVVIQLLDERSPISRKTIPVILRNSKRKSTSTLEDEDVVPKKYEPIDKDFYGRPLVEIDPFIYDEVCTLRDVNVLGPLIELVLKLTISGTVNGSIYVIIIIRIPFFFLCVTWPLACSCCSASPLQYTQT